MNPHSVVFLDTLVIQEYWVLVRKQTTTKAKDMDETGEKLPFPFLLVKVRKGAKIRNRYNQAPHLTQDTNGKVEASQIDITNESEEVSAFPAGDHKVPINRRTRKSMKPSRLFSNFADWVYF